MEGFCNTALVTGATGFIGHRICQLLCDRGWYVVACSRTPKLGPWQRFIERDLIEEIPDSSLDGIHTVFHLAGKAHALSEISKNSGAYFSINTEGTRKLLESAIHAGAQRFIYFSSVKAMGEGNENYGDKGPIDESYATYPSGPYGKSKRAAEKLVLGSKTSIQTTIIRPTMVYGPSSKGNLVKMTEAIQRNRFPPLPNFGNRRSMVHVDDLCSLAISAATSDQAAGKTYIASEPEAYSTRKLYEMICDAINKAPTRWSIPHSVMKAMGLAGDLIGKAKGSRFIFDSDALNKLSTSAWYNGNKACSELDFEYRHNLKSTLPDMVSGLRKQ